LPAPNWITGKEKKVNDGIIVSLVYVNIEK